MQQACLAPSSLNLQPWRFLVLTTSEDKARFQEICYQQGKVSQASAWVVVLGDLEHHKRVEEMCRRSIEQGAMDQEKAAVYVELAEGSYESNAQRRRDEMFRGGSLWAMTFMLLAVDAGWDTAPVAGYDSRRLVKEFGLPETYLPVIAVGIGKAASSAPRGARFGLEELR